MQIAKAVALAATVVLSSASASSAQAARPAGGQAPASPAPGTATAPAAPTTPASPPAARVFTAPVGALFHTVRPERVADFEKLIAYLQAALQKSTSPTVQAQARGWRVFKSPEPGPGGTVMYVFLFDPAVPDADYGIGRILADAYPESVQEIWKLYTSSVTSGGTLMNLIPVEPAATPPAPPTVVPAPAAPAP